VVLDELMAKRSNLLTDIPFEHWSDLPAAPYAATLSHRRTKEDLQFLVRELTIHDLSSVLDTIYDVFCTSKLSEKELLHLRTLDTFQRKSEIFTKI